MHLPDKATSQTHRSRITSAPTLRVGPRFPGTHRVGRAGARVSGNSADGIGYPSFGSQHERCDPRIGCSAPPLPYLRCPIRCKGVGLIAEYPLREGSDLSPSDPAHGKIRRRLLRRDVDRSVLLTCRRPAPGRQGLNGGPSSRRPGKPADGEAPAMAGNRRPPNGCMAPLPAFAGARREAEERTGTEIAVTRAPPGGPGGPARSQGDMVSDPQGHPQGLTPLPRRPSRGLLGPEDNRLRAAHGRPRTRRTLVGVVPRRGCHAG